MKNLKTALISGITALALVNVPLANAQSSDPSQLGGLTDAVFPVVPELMQLSSTLELGPFAPVTKTPSTKEGYGLQGSIQRYLARQGYTLDLTGPAHTRALELAKQGYDGDIHLNSQGISDSLYFADGEGIVSRVAWEDRHAVANWYSHTVPTDIDNPKRSGVATWSVTGGDIYVGQFFTYQ